jgi:hypothetical protein
MVKPLIAAGYDVTGTDIENGVDFLVESAATAFDAIITNPPYQDAQAFIERALSMADYVAMLLRTDYHHARTRLHLFGGGFAKKLGLTRRISGSRIRKASRPLITRGSSGAGIIADSQYWPITKGLDSCAPARIFVTDVRYA